MGWQGRGKGARGREGREGVGCTQGAGVRWSLGRGSLEHSTARGGAAAVVVSTGASARPGRPGERFLVTDS